VAVGHLQEAVEGILAGIFLLEGGGPRAGLEGVLEAQIAAHGDAGLRQLGRGEGADGVGHPEAVALPQQDGGQVVGHQLAQPFESVGHHAIGLFAQREEGTGFFHQAGAREGGVEIRDGHRHLRT